VITDRDVWAAALLMVKRYGEDPSITPPKRGDGGVT
jgi:hypothetical protein